MTLVVMLIGLPASHRAGVVGEALASKITELPEQLRRSLTWDQGREMAEHAAFTIASSVPVYSSFVPRCQGLRGSQSRRHQVVRRKPGPSFPELWGSFRSGDRTAT